MGQKVVIIGGVAGGASCAARLRRLDEDAEIVMLERGPYISYANCGLPYHVGEVIKDRDELLLYSPELMHERFGIDVRVNNEVIALDPAAKTVTIKRVQTGESYSETYDKLVISTGSNPLVPPMTGIDHPNVMTLWTVPDTDRVIETLKRTQAKSAVVIGGGFIGLEMAENLHALGLKVSIVEMQNQVMAPLDYEMSQMLHYNLKQNGVDLYLGVGSSSFEDKDGSVQVNLTAGEPLVADLVILSIGVRPNSALAKAAGLELNARGGIVVNGRMQTSDPDIYAVGDVIEVEDFIDKSRTMIPLAGPANKQGRIAADNIAGGNTRYKGSQGSAVAKVFDLTAAGTGHNEKALQRRGMVKDKDYKTLIITQNSHAGYYPGAAPLTIKLTFSPDGKKIFGAQIVGYDMVDKRIDTLAVAIRLGAGIQDLTELDLAYAPPYSSAKDPVNMAGFTAENMLNGYLRLSEWDALEKQPELAVLDVREPEEVAEYSIPGAINIPLGSLRERLGELDKAKAYVVMCALGVRAYNAAKILQANGFDDVQVYPSGAYFYEMTH